MKKLLSIILIGINFSVNAQNYFGGNSDGHSVGIFSEPQSIFVGGNADGFASSNYNETQNIFTGGNADGFASSNYNETLNIYAGGNADGFASSNYNESLNIFTGGNADGFASNSFNETISIYLGGDADGFASSNYSENLNIFTGGDADGFAFNSFYETLNIFTGGDADGFAFSNYNESLNIFVGGDADGFAFSNYLESLNMYAGGDADGFSMYFLNINPFCSNNVTLWNGTNWSNGIPDATTQAIINGNYLTVNEGNLEACSLQVESNSDFIINPNTYAKIEQDFINNGLTIVDHEGSLVQVDDTSNAINNGTIEIIKVMSSFDAGTDFAILGSPMTGETRDGVYSQNNVTMNHLTSNFIPNAAVATADPSAENFADDNGDNWQFYTTSEAIMPGVGYLVGGITGGGAFTSTYTQGTLNNGVINFNTLYNGSQNASPNVMSNPYASAIDANMFISNNSIVDALYFWEHLTPPSASYPGYRSENWDMGDISMYNLSGGIAAANGGTAPTQYVPSGQGFAIKANTAGIVSFNNAMRVTNPNTGYRNTENTNRIYLNISNETYGLKGSTLIAFTPEATDGIEASYDAKRLATPVSIYSTVADQELAIQGRSVFNEDQLIPLGFRTQVEELQEYTISLGELEGAEITNATVYLQDNLLQTETNLSENNYSFTSEEGNFSNRFMLYFRQEVLGTNEVNPNTISMYPNPVTSKINISSLVGISSISVIDISGRIVKTITTNEVTSLSVDLSQLSAAIYFIKVQTQKGSITKRIIKK